VKETFTYPDFKNQGVSGCPVKVTFFVLQTQKFSGCVKRNENHSFKERTIGIA